MTSNTYGDVERSVIRKTNCIGTGYLIADPRFLIDSDIPLAASQLFPPSPKAWILAAATVAVNPDTTGITANITRHFIYIIYIRPYSIKLL